MSMDVAKDVDSVGRLQDIHLFVYHCCWCCCCCCCYCYYCYEYYTDTNTKLLLLLLTPRLLPLTPPLSLPLYSQDRWRNINYATYGTTTTTTTTSTNPLIITKLSVSWTSGMASSQQRAGQYEWDAHVHTYLNDVPLLNYMFTIWKRRFGLVAAMCHSDPLQMTNSS